MKKVIKYFIYILKGLIIVSIITIFGVCGGALGLFIGIIKNAPDLAEINLKPTTYYTSFIYDQNDKEMDRLSSGENRIYATLDQIPLHLQQAVIAIEDERFYEHEGIDIKGIFRALATNLTTGEFSEGASTITQQLIKNNVLTSEKKLTRKIQEQYLAIQFEKVYTEAYGSKGAKNLILEYYLNTMPLGRGNNGVQAAANRYFNKDVSELTLAESVVLACITQAPTRYDPISNPENNKEKSTRILVKMVEQGYITETEKQVAQLEDPYQLIQEANQEYITESSHSYFVDAVIEEVLLDLQIEKGMSQVEANNLLFGGGVQIYTTFDPSIQSIVDQYISDDTLYPTKAYELKVAYSVTVEREDGSTAHLYAEGIVKSEEEIAQFQVQQKKIWEITEKDKIVAEKLHKMPQPQSAFIIMDHTTGQVKSLSGGRGEKTGDRTFNRATQAKRQPGSVFKVISTYAPALDMGLLSPGTLLIDEPITLNLPSGPYSPNNWDFTYRGPVSVRQAIWHSINTVTVKTLEKVGIDTAYDYLLKFGFTTLSEADKVYALALGGLSEGVTPIELNAAMGVIANGGTYIEPTLYTKIVDREGNVILEKTPKTHRAISEATASMLTDMMEEVIKRGTGGSLNTTFKGMPLAGKTGTTSDDKDFLFSGFTPYYTATIWLGHDQPKPVIATGREHLKIWGSIMNEIHQGLPYRDFSYTTTGYIETSICAVSSKIPTEWCKQVADNKIVTDYFLKQEVPTQACDQHVASQVCSVSGKLANEYCPPNEVEVQVGEQLYTEAVQQDNLCTIHREEPIGTQEKEEGQDITSEENTNLGEILDAETENDFFIPQG